MNKIIPRLLIFFIGLPLAIVIPIFLPGYNQLVFCILVMAASAVASIELSFFFKAKNINVHPVTAAITGFTLPCASYLIGTNLLHEIVPGIFISVFILFTLGKRTFASNEREIDAILPETTAHLFILMYPSFLATYLVKIAMKPESTALILLFYALTFGNDSLAYAFGVIFGKKRNIVTVSPNKSMTGFIAGAMTALLAGVAASFISPIRFPGGPLPWGLFGLVVGIAVIVGDLSESALKRSAGVKDSGSIIPGRGGVLDSVDSLLFAAPVFFYLYNLIVGVYA